MCIVIMIAASDYVPIRQKLRSYLNGILSSQYGDFK